MSEPDYMGWISDYLDGALSDEERKAFETRMAADEALRDAVELERRLLRLLSSTPRPPAPEGFAQRLMERVRAERETALPRDSGEPSVAPPAKLRLGRSSGRRILSPLPRLRFWAQLAAAVVVLVVGIGVYRAVDWRQEVLSKAKVPQNVEPSPASSESYSMGGQTAEPSAPELAPSLDALKEDIRRIKEPTPGASPPAAKPKSSKKLGEKPPAKKSLEKRSKPLEEPTMTPPELTPRAIAAAEPAPRATPSPSPSPQTPSAPEPPPAPPAPLAEPALGAYETGPQSAGAEREIVPSEEPIPGGSARAGIETPVSREIGRPAQGESPGLGSGAENVFRVYPKPAPRVAERGGPPTARQQVVSDSAQLAGPTPEETLEIRTPKAGSFEVASPVPAPGGMAGRSGTLTLPSPGGRGEIGARRQEEHAEGMRRAAMGQTGTLTPLSPGGRGEIGARGPRIEIRTPEARSFGGIGFVERTESPRREEIRGGQRLAPEAKSLATGSPVVSRFASPPPSLPSFPPGSRRAPTSPPHASAAPAPMTIERWETTGGASHGPSARAVPESFNAPRFESRPSPSMSSEASAEATPLPSLRAAGPRVSSSPAPPGKAVTSAPAPPGSEAATAVVVVYRRKTESESDALRRAVADLAKALNSAGGNMRSFQTTIGQGGQPSREIQASVPLNRTAAFSDRLSALGYAYDPSLDGQTLDQALRSNRLAGGPAGAAFYERPPARLAGGGETGRAGSGGKTEAPAEVDLRVRVVAVSK